MSVNEISELIASALHGYTIFLTTNSIETHLFLSAITCDAS